MLVGPCAVAPAAAGVAAPGSPPFANTDAPRPEFRLRPGIGLHLRAVERKCEPFRTRSVDLQRPGSDVSLHRQLLTGQTVAPAASLAERGQAHRVIAGFLFDPQHVTHALEKDLSLASDDGPLPGVAVLAA